MEETKALLYETCKKLLKKHKIDDISVTDIIKEANVSRPTFYRYFNDKYDIANSLLDYLLYSLNEDFQRTRDYATFFKSCCLVIHDEYEILKNVYINSDSQNSFQSYLIEYNIKTYEKLLNMNQLTEEQKFQIYVYAYGCTMVNWKTISGEIKMDYNDVLEYSLKNIPDFIKPVVQIE